MWLFIVFSNRTNTIMKEYKELAWSHKKHEKIRTCLKESDITYANELRERREAYNEKYIQLKDAFEAQKDSFSERYDEYKYSLLEAGKELLADVKVLKEMYLFGYLSYMQAPINTTVSIRGDRLLYKQVLLSNVFVHVEAIVTSNQRPVNKCTILLCINSFVKGIHPFKTHNIQETYWCEEYSSSADITLVIGHKKILEDCIAHIDKNKGNYLTSKARRYLTIITNAYKRMIDNLSLYQTKDFKKAMLTERVEYLDSLTHISGNAITERDKLRKVLDRLEKKND